MEGLDTDQADETVSDYGSDFTADEEEILNNLLRAPQTVEGDNPIKNSSAQLQHFEEHETPRVARIPAGSRYSLRSSAKAEKGPDRSPRHITVAFELDSSPSNHSKFRTYYPTPSSLTTPPPLHELIPLKQKARCRIRIQSR